MRSFLICFLVLLTGLWLPAQVAAFSLENPEKTGLAVVLGSSYDPQPTIGFAQLSLMALYDYEQIMPHRAPDSLRFKFEGNVGVADDSRYRMLASGNFFALYYLRALEAKSFRPYLEAGAGLVYSDFQVDGQGLRINFNPQAGVGAEWTTNYGKSYYTAVRASHLSNSELHRKNRGINMLTFQLGTIF